MTLQTITIFSNFVCLKKHVLHIDSELEMFFYGIQFNGSPLELAWYLNKNKEFSFERSDDIVLQGYNPNDTSFFVRFLHIDEEEHLEYILVSNLFYDQKILPELRQINLLLAVKGGLDMLDESLMLKRFRDAAPGIFIGKIENNKHTNTLKRIF